MTRATRPSWLASKSAGRSAIHARGDVAQMTANVRQPSPAKNKLATTSARRASCRGRAGALLFCPLLIAGSAWLIGADRVSGQDLSGWSRLAETPPTLHYT